MIRAAVRGCGREVPDREIREAVANAEKPRAEEAARRGSKWPAVDAGLLETVVNGSAWDLSSLAHASPVPPWDAGGAEELVDILFPGDPLLCLGESQSRFATRHREEWRGLLENLQFIVPSPMTALSGPRKSDGKPSAHTLANTGPRRFLVAEMDHGAIDMQSAVIAHLADFAPLALVVHSGGKSLHAWFPVRGQSDDQLLRFMRHAVSLGADPATWCRSQFVRVPGGWRPEKGVRQTVHYFDPGTLEGGGA